MSSLTITGNPVLGEDLTVTVSLTGSDTSVADLEWSIWDSPSGGTDLAFPTEWFGQTTITLGGISTPDSTIEGSYVQVDGIFDVSGVVTSSRVGPVTATVVSTATGGGNPPHRKKVVRRYFDDEGNRI